MINNDPSLMTLTEEILTILTSYHKGYRLLRMRMHGINPQLLPSKSHFSNASDNTVRVTLSRLKKKGFIAQDTRGVWKITKKGKEYVPKIHAIFPRHSEISKEKKPRNMIITFDIPEVYKHKRDWLRVELANLEFKLLQKSVWFGPAPLPEQFINSLGKLRLLPHMKFFEAKEADII